MRILLIAALVLAACSNSKSDNKSEPEPEPKPETLPPLDSSCTADSDCAAAPGCCPAPCTGNVINKKDLDKARARLKDRCPENIKCPVAGACQEHLYVCESGKCQITYYGEPAFEKRKSSP